MRRTRTLWPVLCVVLLAAACAPAIRKVPADAGLLAGQAERERQLKALEHWSFTGRIALASRSGGGSGRIQWRQSGSDFVIELSAPVSRQSWRLSRQGGRVSLDGLDGGLVEGDDAQRVLWESTGWLIPVDGMIAWVRGARGPGPWDLEFAPDGLPAQLRQDGWEVAYREWQRDRDPALPVRVFASRDENRVRLQVDDWTFLDPRETDSAQRAH